MARCDHCGNEYDKSFTVTMGDSTHTFDSFECAIHVLAPICSHCSCRIIGHGVETASGRYFCCANCAERAGVAGLRDRQPAMHA
jgi:phage terminase large subunit GpA-like protein